MQYSSLFAGVVLNSLANIMIKAAMRGPQLDPGLAAWRAFFQPSFVGGLVCFGLALLAYSYALQRIDLSIGYPVMTSLGLLIVVSYSAVMFGEPVGGQRLLGVVLILLGVVFVCTSGSGNRLEPEVPETAVTRP